MYFVIMRFYFGKKLKHRDSNTLLVRLHPTTSSTSVVTIRQFIVQIPSMDEILMGYWVVVQGRTTRNIVMYKSKFRMGDMILRRVLMIPCGVLLRSHLRNKRRIYVLGSGRGRVDGLGKAL